MNIADSDDMTRMVVIDSEARVNVRVVALAATKLFKVEKF